MSRMRMMPAINSALIEEMDRDKKVILYGEDAGISLLGQTTGLQERFGKDRVRDTPICENIMTGMAVGAAAAGYRPICHLLYGNFIYTGFDSIANQAAKLKYMTGGQITLPIVYMAVIGGGRSAAAQHSDTPYPALMNLGGIKVVVPSSARSAKGLLKAAIRDDNPVFYLTAGSSGKPEEVPDDDFILPIGKAEILREGNDITIVAIGPMVLKAVEASLALEKIGIHAEVIDLLSLLPIDEETIINSVKKTGRLVIVDEARDVCSAASHIAAIAADKAFNSLKSPVKRVTVDNLAIPYSPILEDQVIPNVENIVNTVRELI
ncbi:alpha-ketoacid dehydrogenase subunit beta [Hyphomicrobiales bacterium]|jgi:pyruvate/2-oxoglutarate/acetoin dehydrogenase E1 component|nr:alpha-ketoacid dehydrogenase subunit beta [Rhodobiaceae bacterium]MDB4831874.1 alpha-ketoacid dehydrogenase subunit beta [Hyphomicrobiales bacterium]MBT5640469.1 alpha-ketoacid dehydrogenase subunit beta [Rhodobiaceae bacterium]MBT6223328.1 alpha-ketoacid dehydrogenase subunit beta [Rhodobiaceae bacterium]MDC0139893.1 alpha-ketoacid dehydrogenase subunit beta [Hyphomicrobiales bacterium]